MRKCIRSWLDEYKNKYYVRLSIIDKASGSAVGTIESRSVQFSKLLALEGIPVAAYILTNEGKLTSPDGLYCLMTKLPGTHADFYEDPDLAYEMGRELARLHTALARIEPKTTCYDNGLLADWQTRIKQSLEGKVSDSIVQNVDTEFRENYPKLPRQLIHRDVHLSNALFDKGRLTGWLNLDISQRIIRIFEFSI